MNATPDKKKPGEFNVRFLFPNQEETYNLPYIPRQGEFVLCANNRKYQITEVVYRPYSSSSSSPLMDVEITVRKTQ